MMAEIAFPTASSLAGYLVCLFMAGVEIAILWMIFDGTIDLSRLISEPTGDASMARFQFLIFTFVISLSLFLVIVSAKNGPAFPTDVPGGILTLLGISGSSYAVGKAIQFSDPAGIEERPVTVTVTPNVASVRFGKTFQFTADVVRKAEAKVKWEVSAGRGSVDDNGLYTAPDKPLPPVAAPAPAPGGVPAMGQAVLARPNPADAPDGREHATIKASLVDYADVSDLAVVTLG